MIKKLHISVLIVFFAFTCCSREDPGVRLYKAIAGNDLDTVIQLIDDGIDLNAYTSAEGQSTLIYAIVTSTDEMVKILLDNGVEQNPPKHPDDRWSHEGIHTALTMDKFDIAETLIKRRVGTDAVSFKNSTLLNHASCKGYTGIVKALLQTGDIDINHISNVAMPEPTALGLARSKGHKEIEAILLEAGAREFGELKKK